MQLTKTHTIQTRRAYTQEHKIPPKQYALSFITYIFQACTRKKKYLKESLLATAWRGATTGVYTAYVCSVRIRSLARSTPGHDSCLLACMYSRQRTWIH